MQRYEAILFDLLTALMDAWSLWNRVAGGEKAGRKWRAECLRLTDGCGSQVPSGSLVAQTARAMGLAGDRARRRGAGAAANGR